MGKNEPMKKIAALSLFSLLTVAALAGQPYNEKTDARQDIKEAEAQAAAGKKSVIVVFGANWCGDCKMLDATMKSGETAALLAHDFTIVKVNVGRFDKNVDLARECGIALDKGIPAVAILSADNKVLYSTKQGELADARKMGPKAIYDFFKRTVAPVAAN